MVLIINLTLSRGGDMGVMGALSPAPRMRMGMWLATVGRNWFSWDSQRCLSCSKAGFGTAARSIGMFLVEI